MMTYESIKKSQYELLKEENVKEHILPYYGLYNANVTQIKFKDTEKQRAVYKIETVKNTFCLKKVYYDKNQLLFVYSAIEWLYRYGINVPRILPTLKGGRFAEKDNVLFILTDWIEGEKCNYDDIENVIDSAKNLACIHKVGTDFKPILGSAKREGFDNIYASNEKHLQELLHCSNLAFKYRDKFSKLFLDSFDTNIILTEKSLEISSTINFSNLRRSLCHGDYVNKNIILDKNKNIYVIDFDKCKMDYCCHDISYFLRRILKRESTKWDLELALNSLGIYDKVLSLTLDDYKYIVSYLSFPQKYWKISKDYYNNISKCNKYSFQTLMHHTASKSEGQLEFIEKLSHHVENKFKCSLNSYRE